MEGAGQQRISTIKSLVNKSEKFNQVIFRCIKFDALFDKKNAFIFLNLNLKAIPRPVFLSELLPASLLSLLDKITVFFKIPFFFFQLILSVSTFFLLLTISIFKVKQNIPLDQDKIVLDFGNSNNIQFLDFENFHRAQTTIANIVSYLDLRDLLSYLIINAKVVFEMRWILKSDYLYFIYQHKILLIYLFLEKYRTRTFIFFNQYDRWLPLLESYNSILVQHGTTFISEKNSIDMSEFVPRIKINKIYCFNEREKRSFEDYIDCPSFSFFNIDADFAENLTNKKIICIIGGSDSQIFFQELIESIGSILIDLQLENEWLVLYKNHPRSNYQPKCKYPFILSSSFVECDVLIAYRSSILEYYSNKEGIKKIIYDWSDKSIESITSNLRKHF